MHFIFFILAVFSYIYAPVEYSQTYCAFLTFLFVLQAALILKKDLYNKNYINFNFIFLFSFFLVTYAFPTFIFGTEIEVFNKYIDAIVDYKYISRATSLSHVAITSYLWAFSSQKRIGGGRTNISIEQKKINWRLLQVLYYASFVAVFLLYLKHFVQGGGVAVIESPFLYDIYRVIFTLYLILATLDTTPREASVLVFVRNNRYIFLTSGLFLLLCLLIGDRGPILNIGIVTIATYMLLVRKIKLITLIMVAFLALVLMFSLRVTRVGNSSLAEGGINSFVQQSQSSMTEANGLWTMFSDLTGISSEMTVGYEIVQREGVQYPMSIFVVLFSPIPKAPSIISNLLYSTPPAEITSGKIIQKYVASVFEWNNGTHCVMDIYIHWGCIGVVVVFFLFGLCIGVINKRKALNVQYLVIYIFILSIALYIPRSSVFDIMRPIFYIIVFLFIITKRKRSIEMTNR